jgi:hypothetical protein
VAERESQDALEAQHLLHAEYGRVDDDDVTKIEFPGLIKIEMPKRGDVRPRIDIEHVTGGNALPDVMVLAVLPAPASV